MLLLVIGAAVLLGVGGLLGATYVKSPAQLAAEQRPAPPTVLTAPVKRQVVGASVVLRGTVAGSREIQATPVPVTTGAEGGAAGPPLTAVRKSQGDTVNAGEVIVEVAGRPLVALPGDEPAYRDLRPGDSGKDVTMRGDQEGGPVLLRAAGVQRADRRRRRRGVAGRAGRRHTGQAKAA
jgi:hypothetical protein